MPQRVLTAAAAIQGGQAMNLNVYARLRPTLVGGWAKLRRYVTGEKQSLGAYVSGVDTAYDWPGLLAGEVVDQDFTEVHIEQARLRYLNKPIGTNGTAIPPASPPNRVRASALVFKTANGTSRSATFGDRDVTAGDVVKLSAIISSVLVEYTSTVTGFVGEAVAAITGTATEASTNAANQSAVTPAAAVVSGSPANYIEAAGSGTYSSLADGAINRVYTVTVTQSSTGADITTGRLRVRSSDGLDDVDDVVPSALTVATAIGTKGALLTFTSDNGNAVDSGIDADDLVAGQAWTLTCQQAFTKPTSVTAAGTYTGTANHTVIVTVSTGGTLASGTAKITAATEDGSDNSGPTTVTAAGAAIAAGSFNTTIAFGGGGSMLRKGDVYSFSVTAATEGAVRTLVMLDDVPSSLRTGGAIDCNLELMIQLDTVELPRTRTSPSSVFNWSQSATQITIEGGIYMTTDGLTTSGVDTYVPLVSGTVYPHYRAWSPGTGAPLRVATVAEAISTLGSVEPDNPLGYAAAKALGNTATALLDSPSPQASAATDPIIVVPVDDPLSGTTGWQTALNSIEGETDSYNLVPLSDDPDVHALFVTQVAALSIPTVGGWRRAMLPAKVTSPKKVAPATDTVVSATVTSGTSGNNLVTSNSGSAFVTNGVRAGDTFRVSYGVDAFGEESYSSYTVSSVTSETTMYLTSGPASPIPVAVRMEVWRVPPTSELVTELKATAAGYASDRVLYVWPDTASDDSVTADGYAVVSAVAGLMGSVPSQQGLKGVGIEGFTAMTRSLGLFTDTQLNDLANNGVFIVAVDSGGNAYIRNPVTTDPTSANTREETRGRNGDAMRFKADDCWASTRGVSNILDEIVQFLQAKFDQAVAELKGANSSRTLGPPAVGMTITSITPVVGQPDALNIAVTMTAPYPLNATNLTLTLT